MDVNSVNASKEADVPVTDSDVFHIYILSIFYGALVVSLTRYRGTQISTV